MVTHIRERYAIFSSRRWTSCRPWQYGIHVAPFIVSYRTPRSVIRRTCSAPRVAGASKLGASLARSPPEEWHPHSTPAGIESLPLVETPMQDTEKRTLRSVLRSNRNRYSLSEWSVNEARKNRFSRTGCRKNQLEWIQNSIRRWLRVDR